MDGLSLAMGLSQLFDPNRSQMPSNASCWWVNFYLPAIFQPGSQDPCFVLILTSLQSLLGIGCGWVRGRKTISMATQTSPVRPLGVLTGLAPQLFLLSLAVAFSFRLLVRLIKYHLTLCVINKDRVLRGPPRKPFQRVSCARSEVDLPKNKKPN